jgi:GntR family transcriptional regulator
MTVARQSGVPLYLQVKEIILKKIEAGTWPEGSMLPAENRLCEELKVSKITIREAMRLLVREERVERIPGKGTFVAGFRSAKFENKLGKFFSFTRWARQNGLEPVSRVLRVELQQRTPELSKRLCLTEEMALVRIERLRLGSNEPLMLENIWVAGSLCPGLHLKDLSNVPFNDLLQQEYGITLVRAIESFEVATADDHVSTLLDVPVGAPLLAIEYTTFGQDSQAVYFVSAIYRSDRIKFTIELTR